MTGTFSSTALAWLLTYAIHSTVLLSLAWLLVRARRWSPGASELLWKSAMLGGIVTASVQLYLDVRPTGTIVLQRPAVTTSATALAPVDDAGSGMREAGRPSPFPPPASLLNPKTSAPVRNTDITSPSQSALEPARPAISLSRTSAAVLAWALVALILGLSYVARRLILVGRLGDRHAVPEGRLLQMLRELALDAGLRRTPRLTCTSRISSPIALGVSEICVPETALTDLDVEQQRSLLAHELAHLARRDPVWVGLASLIERVFWIQPLNRVANRQIATSAEFLCDDWAVRRTGSGIPLARCLAQVAEWIQASPLGVPVAGMAEERSLLVSRVDRLLAGVNPTTRSRRGLAIAAVAVLVATIVVAPGVSGKSGNVLLADEAQTLSEEDGSDFDDLERPSTSASQSTSRASVVPRASYARQDASADTGVVEALVARLQDENAEVRRAAAHSLGRLKDSRAVPGLIGALKDSDPQVRASAAEALAEFEDSRAIAPLVALLNDPSTEVKQSALDALSHFEQGVPSTAIVRLLGDADAEVRHKAAHIAGKLRDRSATAALAKLVRDPSSDVRQAAIEAIGELKDPGAASAVTPALSDSDADVRQQAINTMEELKAPIAESTLIGLMRDPDADVRQQAAHLAGERSVIGAIPTLRRMLEDPNGDVRQSAVEALGNIADGAAYEALRAALTSKDAKVRRAAAEALGERGS
ncbi:MAG TPA: M56 family metallopeptidase [Gemmatimonadaceae bacterium]|nr:M56 family metallopeptidase [Gemmatimonadaceae bacterium]